LRELLGPVAMMKMLAKGHVYNAVEALDAGLIDRITKESDSTIDETALDLLRELRSLPHHSLPPHLESVRAVKELAYGPETTRRIEKELEHEREIFARLWASTHHMNAISPKARRASTKQTDSADLRTDSNQLLGGRS